MINTLKRSGPIPGITSRVARSLEEARRARKMTYSQLAKASGISQTQVYKLTHDQLRSAPNPEHLHRLATALGIDYAELLQAARDDVGARRFADESVVVFSRQDLTDEDWHEVRRIVEHLRAKNRQQPAK